MLNPRLTPALDARRLSVAPYGWRCGDVHRPCGASVSVPALWLFSDQDVTTEPYEAGGPLGCLNLSDRIAESLDAHEAYRAMQKRAQPWALAHGWPKDMDQP